MHRDNDTFTFGLVRQSVSSPHNSRFMSQARRTRHFARIARRGEETKIKLYLFVLPSSRSLLSRRFSWSLYFVGRNEIRAPLKTPTWEATRLALRTRFALRAKCHVCLAWLIKRLLCGLICISKDYSSTFLS